MLRIIHRHLEYMSLNEHINALVWDQIFTICERICVRTIPSCVANCHKSMESAHLNRRRDGLSHRLLIRICMRAVSNGDTHNHILQFKQIHAAPTCKYGSIIDGSVRLGAYSNGRFHWFVTIADMNLGVVWWHFLQMTNFRGIEERSYFLKVKVRCSANRVSTST